MFSSNTAWWALCGLLFPFWWAMGLAILALLGDMSPFWQTRVLRIFDWLERAPGKPIEQRKGTVPGVLRYPRATWDQEGVL